MYTSFYLNTLQTATLMDQALNDDVKTYTKLLAKRLRQIETKLFDNEYFVQKVEWKNLRAKNPLKAKSMVNYYTPKTKKLLKKEGPKYQYGRGYLADGVLDAWLTLVCC